MMMIMTMIVMMVCETHVFHNSYTQFLLPLPLPKHCTSLWLLSWMVPLTANSATTTTESSSCVHKSRTACIYCPHVDPGSRSGIFYVGLCLQALSWVLDDSYIMHCNAIYCVRSWSFKQKYSYYWHTYGMLVYCFAVLLGYVVIIYITWGEIYYVV